MNIEISTLANSELENAIEYYNLQQLKLGDNFKYEIKQDINSISQNPNLYPDVADRLKRVVIYKFPYNIYYTILKDKIVIVSIAHQHRRPFYKIKKD